MHSMGLHSALAIKRQRKRRADQKKAKQRRYSIQSTESALGMAGSHSSCSPRNSVDGLDRHHRHKRSKSNKANSFDDNVGIGILHVGVVFVVLGIFLLGSGLMPRDLDNWEWKMLFTKEAWWNELVVTGSFAIALGIFLVVVDKFVSKREEDDLNDYVQRQLTRSKSGHRLVRDVETGNLTTKRSKSSTPITHDLKSDIEELPQVHSPVVKSPPANYSTTTTTTNHVFMNGDAGMLSPQLEKILEEDVSDRIEEDFRHVHDEYDSTTASVSPGTPSDTQELLIGTPAYSSNIKVNVPSKYHQVRMSKI